MTPERSQDRTTELQLIQQRINHERELREENAKALKEYNLELSLKR